MTVLGVRGAPSSFVIPAEAGTHGCGSLMARADAGCAVSMGPGFRRDDDGGSVLPDSPVAVGRIATGASPFSSCPRRRGSRRTGVAIAPRGPRVWIPACAGMTVLGVRGAPSPFVIPAEAGTHGCGTPVARADAGCAVSMGPGFRRDDDG